MKGDLEKVSVFVVLILSEKTLPPYLSSVA